MVELCLCRKGIQLLSLLILILHWLSTNVRWLLTTKFPMVPTWLMMAMFLLSLPLLLIGLLQLRTLQAKTRIPQRP